MPMSNPLQRMFGDSVGFTPRIRQEGPDEPSNPFYDQPYDIPLLYEQGLGALPQDPYRDINVSFTGNSTTRDTDGMGQVRGGLPTTAADLPQAQMTIPRPVAPAAPPAPPQQPLSAPPVSRRSSFSPEQDREIRARTLPHGFIPENIGEGQRLHLELIYAPNLGPDGRPITIRARGGKMPAKKGKSKKAGKKPVKKAAPPKAMQDASALVDMLGEANEMPGGQVAGPGTGRSDDIPMGFADGGEGVALSRDEYVIPADVVSALGEGSSDAGADLLDAMVMRTRKGWQGKLAESDPPHAGRGKKLFGGSAKAVAPKLPEFLRPFAGELVGQGVPAFAVNPASTVAGFSPDQLQAFAGQRDIAINDPTDYFGTFGRSLDTAQDALAGIGNRVNEAGTAGNNAVRQQMAGVNMSNAAAGRGEAAARAGVNQANRYAGQGVGASYAAGSRADTATRNATRQIAGAANRSDTATAGAIDALVRAGQPVTPDAIRRAMNPFEDQVVKNTLRDFDREQEKDRATTALTRAGRGSFGIGRDLAETEEQRAQDEERGDLISSQRERGYDVARGQAERDLDRLGQTGSTRLQGAQNYLGAGQAQAGTSLDAARNFLSAGGARSGALFDAAGNAINTGNLGSRAGFDAAQQYLSGGNANAQTSLGQGNLAVNRGNLLQGQLSGAGQLLDIGGAGRGTALGNTQLLGNVGSAYQQQQQRLLDSPYNQISRLNQLVGGQAVNAAPSGGGSPLSAIAGLAGTALGTYFAGPVGGAAGGAAASQLVGGTGTDTLGGAARGGRLSGRAFGGAMPIGRPFAGDDSGWRGSTPPRSLPPANVKGFLAGGESYPGMGKPAPGFPGSSAPLKSGAPMRAPVPGDMAADWQAEQAGGGRPSVLPTPSPGGVPPGFGFDKGSWIPGWAGGPAGKPRDPNAPRGVSTPDVWGKPGGQPNGADPRLLDTLKARAGVATPGVSQELIDAQNQAKWQGAHGLPNTGPELTLQQDRAIDAANAQRWQAAQKAKTMPLSPAAPVPPALTGANPMAASLKPQVMAPTAAIPAAAPGMPTRGPGSLINPTTAPTPSINPTAMTPGAMFNNVGGLKDGGRVRGFADGGAMATGDFSRARQLEQAYQSGSGYDPALQAEYFKLTGRSLPEKPRATSAPPAGVGRARLPETGPPTGAGRPPIGQSPPTGSGRTPELPMGNIPDTGLRGQEPPMEDRTPEPSFLPDETPKFGSQPFEQGRIPAQDARRPVPPSVDDRAGRATPGDAVPSDGVPDSVKDFIGREALERASPLGAAAIQGGKGAIEAIKNADIFGLPQGKDAPVEDNSLLGLPKSDGTTFNERLNKAADAIGLPERPGPGSLSRVNDRLNDAADAIGLPSGLGQRQGTPMTTPIPAEPAAMPVPPPAPVQATDVTPPPSPAAAITSAGVNTRAPTPTSAIADAGMEPRGRMIGDSQQFPLQGAPPPPIDVTKPGSLMLNVESMLADTGKVAAADQRPAPAEPADDSTFGERFFDSPFTQIGLRLLASNNPSFLGALGEAGLGTAQEQLQGRRQKLLDKREARQEERGARQETREDERLRLAEVGQLQDEAQRAFSNGLQEEGIRLQREAAALAKSREERDALMDAQRADLAERDFQSNDAYRKAGGGREGRKGLGDIVAEETAKGIVKQLQGDEYGGGPDEETRARLQKQLEQLLLGSSNPDALAAQLGLTKQPAAP